MIRSIMDIPAQNFPSRNTEKYTISNNISKKSCNLIISFAKVAPVDSRVSKLARYYMYMYTIFTGEYSMAMEIHNSLTLP